MSRTLWALLAAAIAGGVAFFAFRSTTTPAERLERAKRMGPASAATVMSLPVPGEMTRGLLSAVTRDGPARLLESPHIDVSAATQIVVVRWDAVASDCGRVARRWMELTDRSPKPGSREYKAAFDGCRKRSEPAKRCQELAESVPAFERCADVPPSVPGVHVVGLVGVDAEEVVATIVERRGLKKHPDVLEEEVWVLKNHPRAVAALDDTTVIAGDERGVIAVVRTWHGAGERLADQPGVALPLALVDDEADVVAFGRFLWFDVKSRIELPGAATFRERDHGDVELAWLVDAPDDARIDDLLFVTEQARQRQPSLIVLFGGAPPPVDWSFADNLEVQPKPDVAFVRSSAKTDLGGLFRELLPTQGPGSPYFHLAVGLY